MARRSRHIGRLGKVGIRKVTVPSLSGLSRSQAKDLLNSVGLNWTETSSVVQNINLDNVIENQGIASGATVKIGDSVSFSYYLYVAPTTTTPAPTTTTTPAPPPYPNISSAVAYGAGAGQSWTQNQAYIAWSGSGWGSYTVVASNGSSNNEPTSSSANFPVLLSGFSAGTTYSVTVTLYANANYSGSSASASTSFTTASAPATTTPAPPTTTPAPSCGIMPNVVGLSESSASNAVVAQGIAYEYTVEYDNSQGATPQNNGTVAAQDPSPGFNTGTCNYTYNATLYIYRYSAATTTTTPAPTTYPALLSGYHYCAAGDAPNPASPCPSNGSGTGVNCVNNGASGPSCPDPNATTTTTPAPTTTTAAPTYPAFKPGLNRCTPQDIANPSSPCTSTSQCFDGAASGASCSTTTSAPATTAAPTTTSAPATTSRPRVYWKCNSADVANPSNPCGYVGQCLYDGNTYFPAGC